MSNSVGEKHLDKKAGSSKRRTKAKSDFMQVGISDNC